jgi:hypothetical protein
MGGRRASGTVQAPHSRRLTGEPQKHGGRADIRVIRSAWEKALGGKWRAAVNGAIRKPVEGFRPLPYPEPLLGRPRVKTQSA